MRLASAIVATCASACLLSLPVAAFIPGGERIERAMSEVNVASGRDSALRIELELRIDDGPVVGYGDLVSHPQGLARLELRGSGDLVERHVLQGTEHRASRNGRALDSPRAFLPPLFLLQADTATTLRAALGSFGVHPDEVGLAPCGARDCFVIGDPARVPPPLPVDDAPALEGDRLPEPSPRPMSDADPPRTRIWVDVETYELLRIDFAAGQRVTLGPVAVFDQVRFPSWVLIEEPGRRPARFAVKRVVAVNAPAAAFSHRWLVSGSDDASGEPPYRGAGDPPAAGGAAQ